MKEKPFLRGSVNAGQIDIFRYSQNESFVCELIKRKRKRKQLKEMKEKPFFRGSVDAGQIDIFKYSQNENLVCELIKEENVFPRTR